MDPMTAELISNTQVPADTVASPEILDSFTKKMEEQKKPVTEELTAMQNGEQTVQPIANAPMSTDSSHDPFASITKVQAQEAQQEIRFQAIENSEQTGLNKPVAPEGGESNTSLMSEIIETADSQLYANLKETENLKNEITKTGLTIEEKAEKTMELSGKLATTGFQLVTLSGLGKGTEKAGETLMRN